MQVSNCPQSYVITWSTDKNVLYRVQTKTYYTEYRLRHIIKSTDLDILYRVQIYTFYVECRFRHII